MSLHILCGCTKGIWTVMYHQNCSPSHSNTAAHADHKHTQQSPSVHTLSTQKAQTQHEQCSYFAVKCTSLFVSSCIIHILLSKHSIRKHAFSPLHFYSFTHVCKFQNERLWMCQDNKIIVILSQNTQEPLKSIWTKNYLPITFCTNIPGLFFQETIFTNRLPLTSILTNQIPPYATFRWIFT